MKVAITVTNRHEAELIKAAMDDASVRAFVVVTGALMQLNSARARQRVMTFVADHFEEQNSEPKSEENK